MPDDFNWRRQAGVFRASLPEVLGLARDPVARLPKSRKLVRGTLASVGPPASRRHAGQRPAVPVFQPSSRPHDFVGERQ